MDKDASLQASEEARPAVVLSMPPGAKPRLDRDQWHRPLASIIITHRNYSTHVGDALLSILDQSHDNWECVVVDDASDSAQLDALKSIIDRIGSPRIKLLSLAENVGQIPAFFAGLDVTAGEFVCLLDPDDRYAKTFLEEAIQAHLNQVVYCPLVATDQVFLGESVITGTTVGFQQKLHLQWQEGYAVVPQTMPAQLIYYPSTRQGWLWSSTSAMMFRRSALYYLRPRKTLAYKRAADAYLAAGAHLLGGSMFLTKPLIYRSVHGGNSYLTPRVFATWQEKKRDDFGPLRNTECVLDVTEAIIENGGERYLPKALPPSPPAPQKKKRKKKTFSARLKRSIRKRVDYIAGRHDEVAG